jgi:hypothetical protein
LEAKKTDSKSKTKGGMKKKEKGELETDKRDPRE